ncbi:flippase-like domain-containing protein [Thermobifida halotolerans]|uniref:Flippase-like domain-containing protein n=1 Tax=Thermobifida halotolerans TaxID=483545 RepID=A0AA97LUD2_9ACTN|nr:lysylphosphatidylglycerol synthase domain-containing protein [Thermobifida halotolerans]UOE18234.1 flippase-like domain-containing protein [Thermobifida halotolerans]
MISRLRASRWVRAAVVVAVLGCAAVALRARWEEAGAALAALSPWTVAGALAAALAGLGAQMLAWRALLADLGSPLPPPVAARVMFVGQLGKYLPGSVWAFVAQVELAWDRQVPRRRGAAATVLAVAVTLTVNLLVAAVLLPLSSPEAARRWWWVLAAVPFLLAALHPRAVTWLLHRALRLTGRLRAQADAELDRVGARGVAAAVGWSLAAWVPLGVHVWLLVAGVGGGWGSWPVSTGGYALAWTLGVVAVFAPAGLGVREVVLVAALAPVLDPGSALVVAGLSRLVMTVADLVWALLCLAAVRSPAVPGSR